MTGTAPQTGYAPVNGLRLYYEIHGQGTGTPLVLLHGGLDTIETCFAASAPCSRKTWWAVRGRRRTPALLRGRRTGRR
jgi:pimeloyl-ACP methyl ester carboxylesterase